MKAYQERMWLCHAAVKILYPKGISFKDVIKVLGNIISIICGVIVGHYTIESMFCLFVWPRQTDGRHSLFFSDGWLMISLYGLMSRYFNATSYASKCWATGHEIIFKVPLIWGLMINIILDSPSSPSWELMTQGQWQQIVKMLSSPGLVDNDQAWTW